MLRVLAFLPPFLQDKSEIFRRRIHGPVLELGVRFLLVPVYALQYPLTSILCIGVQEKVPASLDLFQVRFQRFLEHLPHQL